MTQLSPLPGEPMAEPAAAIAATLREEILLAQEGQFLGSETELRNRFGVSRPTFQQAMRILQSEGLLRIHRGVGGGLFARLPAVDGAARALSLLLRHRGATYAEVGDVLFALACELVRLAANNPDANERCRVQNSVASFAPPPDVDEPTKILLAAAQFGELMADLAGNGAITLLVEVFLRVIPDQMAAAPGLRGRYGESRRFHLAAADAVAEGNEVRAARVMVEMRSLMHSWFS
jgi:GntR family transcriptional repressor for pyruvate dehydrogenase complex